MKTPFASNDEREELVRSIAATVERHSMGGPVVGVHWSAIGDLGALALGTDLGGGCAADLRAAAHVLGWWCVQGPLVGAVLGVRSLPDEAEAIAAGGATVGVADDRVVAWSDADVILTVVDGVWHRATLSNVEPFDSLAGEPWARADVQPVAPVGLDAAAVAAAEVARAAWLVGAGQRITELAATHARDRVQFGQPIGNFQAVAHALAMSTAHLAAADDLTTLAAIHLDALDDDGIALADAARRAATDAAMDAAFVSHQVHGAVGFSAEHGLDRWTAAIRQLSHHPPLPSDDRLVELAGRAS